MTGLLSGIGIGFLVTAVGAIAITMLLRRGKRSKMSVKVHGSVDEMKPLANCMCLKSSRKKS